MTENILGAITGLSIALALVFFICWRIDRERQEIKTKWLRWEIMSLISSIISDRRVSEIEPWAFQDLRDDLEMFATKAMVEAIKHNRQNLRTLLLIDQELSKKKK